MNTIQDYLSLTYLIVVLLGAAIAVYLVVYAALRPPSLLRQMNLAVVLLIGLTVGCFLLHSLAPTVEIMRFLTKLRFLFLALIPVGYVLYIGAYTGMRELFRLSVLVALLIVPLITMSIVLSPYADTLFWVDWSAARYGLLWVEVPTPGLWFYVYNVYSFIVVAAALTLLIAHGYRSTSGIRRRGIWIAGATLIGYSFILPAALGALPRGALNPTPLGYTVLLLLWWYITIRFRVLDAIPVAHESLLRLLKDPIVIVDLSDHILDVNLPAEALLGDLRADLIGRTPRELSPAHAQPLSALLAQPDGQREIVWGSTSFDVNVSPILRQNGSPYGRVMVFRDISERKAAEQQREALVRGLDAYAHTVAHDLKSPLGLIVGYSDFLLDALRNPQANDTPADYVVKIRANADRMLQIIDDILVFATLRDQTVIDAQPTDVYACLQSALTRLESMITLTNAHIDLPSTMPAALGVESWIEQVWVNYLSNAIKYGGTPPHLAIAAELHGAFVRYTVRDNGDGLTPEQQARLFHEVTRLETRRASGTGLGLTIVARIVHKLGGDVGVESQLGAGSTFWFTLPCIAAGHAGSHNARNDVVPVQITSV
jgi:PAS domain S-box-containing protein